MCIFFFGVKFESKTIESFPRRLNLLQFRNLIILLLRKNHNNPLIRITRDSRFEFARLMHTEVILSSDVIFELKTIKSFLILEFDRDNVINAYLDHAKLNFLH